MMEAMDEGLRGVCLLVKPMNATVNRTVTRLLATRKWRRTGLLKIFIKTL